VFFDPGRSGTPFCLKHFPLSLSPFAGRLFFQGDNLSGTAPAFRQVGKSRRPARGGSRNIVIGANVPFRHFCRKPASENLPKHKPQKIRLAKPWFSRSAKFRNRNCSIYKYPKNDSWKLRMLFCCFAKRTMADFYVAFRRIVRFDFLLF
jgi:hypothetical protein